MKKLKLNLQFEGAEVLTKSQLKKVLGGVSGSGSGDGCPVGYFLCTDNTGNGNCLNRCVNSVDECLNTCA